MASNFKISTQQNNGTFYLDLNGDFDGSAACQLIHVLKTNYRKGVTFNIDTGSLSCIYPFGLTLFQKDCGINNLSECLTFTGKYEDVLSAKGSHQK